MGAFVIFGLMAISQRVPGSLFVSTLPVPFGEGTEVAMTVDEIKQYISISRGKAACVDISLLPEFPGMIREIFFWDGHRVRINFESYGYHEGGAYFTGDFKSLEAAVAAIEEYLGQECSQWENFTRTGRYPERPDWDDFESGGIKLKQAILSCTLRLPSEGNFHIFQESWWVKPEA